MGTSVTVLEKAEGGDWYRVARGGAALGYVYAPLIRPQCRRHLDESGAAP